jgi:hypothetical protein
VEPRRGAATGLPRLARIWLSRPSMDEARWWMLMAAPLIGVTLSLTIG